MKKDEEKKKEYEGIGMKTSRKKIEKNKKNI